MNIMKFKYGLILMAAIFGLNSSWSQAKEAIIQGSEGNDELHGTKDNDVIYGGNGNDIIYGGYGADRLYGGLGADQFVIDFSELGELDIIEDFNPDEGDIIVLTFRNRVIRNTRIPKEIGTENVKVDRKGNLKILMDDSEWLSIMGLKRTDMYFVVENESDVIRFVFKRRF